MWLNRESKLYLHSKSMWVVLENFLHHSPSWPSDKNSATFQPFQIPTRHQELALTQSITFKAISANYGTWEISSYNKLRRLNYWFWNVGWISTCLILRMWRRLAFAPTAFQWLGRLGVILRLFVEWTLAFIVSKVQTFFITIKMSRLAKKELLCDLSDQWNIGF